MGMFYTVLAGVMRATRPVLPIYIAGQVQSELRIGIKHLLYSRRTGHQLVQLQGCRVNIGCGHNPTPGWINLDLATSPDVHYWDCRRGLPFADNAVAAIYCEHMFEHFDLETEAKPFLQECRRCLRPGGVIRLVVPDAGAYLRAYGKAWESLARIRPLYRVENGWKDRWEANVYSTQMEFINYVFRQDYEHKYAYDEETLVIILQNTGFSNIVRQSYGISLDSKMAPDREDRSSESLYVEAVK
jgi:predicted SAM-dependent methyltransferase